MAKLQMGLFSLATNGVFLSNPSDSSYCLQQFPVSSKPFFGITVNSITVKKSWVLDARTARYRFRNVLATGSGYLEKGMQFSPSFDDYVKVMESVKTERGKDLSYDIGERGLKKRSLGNDASGARERKGNDTREKRDDHRRRRGATKSSKYDTVGSSVGGWDLVEGVFEKISEGKSGDRRDGRLRDGRSRSNMKFEGAGGNADRAHFKKVVRLENYLKNSKDTKQKGRDRQKVGEVGIRNEWKETSGYGSYEVAKENVDRSHFKKEARFDKYLKNPKETKQNGRQSSNEVGIHNEGKGASGYGSYRKLRDTSRARNEYLTQEISHDNISEEFKKRQAEHKGKWTNDRISSLTTDKYTYRNKTENRSYGNLGDTTRVESDSHARGQIFSYDDNSEEFNKRQVEEKKKWAHDRTDILTTDKYTYYRNKMKREKSDYETRKSLHDREKPEEPVSDRLYKTSSSKESTGSNTHNNKWNDDIQVTVVQRKTAGELGSEMNIEMDAERYKHKNYMEENRAWSGIHTPKRDFRIYEKVILEKGANQTHPIFLDGATDTGLTSGFNEMSGSSSINVSKTLKFTGRGINTIDHEDRAAFRTFEVFTDVRNRPRILRMEMEERIKKLAKWLNATDVNMPEWKFSKMMHSAEIKFTDHTILRVVQILGALGNWKRVLQVVEWLHSRERFKSYKSRYIYTTVLDVLGKAKRPIEALNIFNAMRQELSSYPDLAAYHCIAVALGQAGLINELFDVIDCMRAAPEKKFKLGPLQKWDPRLEPDLVIYNAVLNACVQQKQWEGAFWVLQQLNQSGIKATNTTYGLAMEVMLASGKYNLVHEFFRKVNKISIPSALNYKVLINTLWREGKVDEAVQAVKDMERRGIVGSASLYYDLARCLCSAGRCEEALLQVDKICKVAKKPLVVTYTGLIQSCLDSGSIDNGAYIFNQMQKFCSPNSVTCNIMLKSYLEHGKFEEAKELFHKILDESHQFDNKSSLRQKVIPDKFMFNTMMESCAATNNWDEFENVYGQMLYHGFHFDTKRHLRMVLDAFRAGKVQVLETTWEHLVRSGRILPSPMIKERFCMKLEEDDHAAAISCIGTHQNIEMENFSEKAWLNLINSSADRLKKNTISRLASEVSNLIEESDHPHPIFKNLLDACREFLSFRRNLVGVPDNNRTRMYDLQLNS